MFDALRALASSRKFWVGTVTVMAIAGATLLVALGKLDAGQLTATIAGVTATGIAVIGSIAWEDTASKKAAGSVVAERMAAASKGAEDHSVNVALNATPAKEPPTK